MEKVPGVLVPPVKFVGGGKDIYNPNIIVSSICMFGYANDKAISFSLLNGHLVEWRFNYKEQCDLAMQGIYDQLGVIE